MPETQQLIDIIYIFLRYCVYPVMWYFVLCGMLTPKFGRLVSIVLPAGVSIALSYIVTVSGMDYALRVVTVLILFAVPAFLLYSDDIRIKIMAVLALILLVLLCDISMAGIAYLIYGEDGPVFDDPPSWRSIIDQVSMIIISGAVYFGFLSLWKRRFKHIRSKKLSLFYLFPFGQILYIMAFFFQYKSFEQVFSTPYPYAAIAVSIVSDVIMLRALIDEDKYEETQRQAELSLRYYDTLAQQYDEIRKYRHDINNLITAAQTLIDGGATESEGRALLEDIKTAAQNTKVSFFCADPMINAIIWQKQKEAAQLGIDFRVDLAEASEFPLTRMEKCSVFSNLIDNAVNGAAICSEGTRFVTLTAKSEHGMLIVVAENSSVFTFDSEKGSSEDRLRRRGFHGQGIDILKGIAGKHDGRFTVRAGSGKARAIFAILAEKQK